MPLLLGLETELSLPLFNLNPLSTSFFDHFPYYFIQHFVILVMPMDNSHVHLLFKHIWSFSF